MQKDVTIGKGRHPYLHLGHKIYAISQKIHAAESHELCYNSSKSSRSSSSVSLKLGLCSSFVFGVVVSNCKCTCMAKVVTSEPTYSVWESIALPAPLSLVAPFPLPDVGGWCCSSTVYISPCSQGENPKVNQLPLNHRHETGRDLHT